MTYRRLGRSGLKVSVLSFGSWVTFGPQLGTDTAAACMQAARDAGVNFFDNAEVYAGGESERIMGEVIADLGWARESYVLSSKFFWGITGDVNADNTLNRKYLLGAVPASLERLGVDYLDLVYCHRPDPDTPIEETVWAMHDIVDRGMALYWGTSEWSAESIQQAYAAAERLGLRAPVVEQPQYNLLFRDRVETEYAPLYEEYGMGTTIWSPLASGLLSGKYLDGIPDGTRASLDGYEWLRRFLTDEANNDKLRALQGIAEELGCTMAQLSIAWCAYNPNVSTVITGASRVEQVSENMAALDVLSRLDGTTVARIEAAVA